MHLVTEGTSYQSFLSEIHGFLAYLLLWTVLHLLPASHAYHWSCARGNSLEPKIYNIFYTNFSFPCLSSTFFHIFFVKNVSLIVWFFFFTLLKICCIFQEGQFSWRENRIKVYCNKEPWEQGQSGLDYSFKLNLRKCWAFVFGKDWAFIL